MDIDQFIREVRHEGTRIEVVDGKGTFIARYDTLAVSKDFFRLSNGEFFGLYGFSFVPPEPYYTKARDFVLKERNR